MRHLRRKSICGRPLFARKFESGAFKLLASICPAYCCDAKSLAKMESAARGPTSRSGLVMPLDFTECLAFLDVDCAIFSLSCKLRSHGVEPGDLSIPYPSLEWHRSHHRSS